MNFWFSEYKQLCDDFEAIGYDIGKYRLLDQSECVKFCIVNSKVTLWIWSDEMHEYEPYQISEVFDVLSKKVQEIIIHNMDLFV